MTIELTDAGRNEYEALVRDAKRYRWLRECEFSKCPGLEWEMLCGYAHMDAAIDAEMEAK